MCGGRGRGGGAERRSGGVWPERLLFVLQRVVHYLGDQAAKGLLLLLVRLQLRLAVVMVTVMVVVVLAQLD